MAQLPVKPITSAQAARIWKLRETEARKVLDELAGRAILLDLDYEDTRKYVLPPPMAGFFEFSMMRVRDDVDQKILAELFYQYLNVEEDFIRELFTHGETQLGRTFVQEPMLSEENSLHVLDYERASEVIRTASAMGVGICYCRHKMSHIEGACDAPMDICMTFNRAAESLIRHGVARQVDTAEGLELLDRAYEYGLVQFGENVSKRVKFICNCCGCCCEAMIAARRFAWLNPVHTSNFIPVLDSSACNGCGKCVEACPVEAINLVSANDPRHPKMKIARHDEDLCLGCGVCVRACPENALSLERCASRVFTPVTSAHRTVVMAIERGKLQNLIFDNQALLSHRAMAAILGVILKLPPIKQAMASRQMKSRYLETLILRRR